MNRTIDPIVETATRRLRGYISLMRVLSAMIAVLAVPPAQAAGPWDQPAAHLADQIARILGPSQAKLQIDNRSTIAAGEVASIRRLLQQDLRTDGVIVSGAESANSIHVTFSEDDTERLWVAQVAEGNETQVIMVRLDRPQSPSMTPDATMVLQKRRIWRSDKLVSPIPLPADSVALSLPVLSALEIPNGLVVLRQGQIAILNEAVAGHQAAQLFDFNPHLPLSRDPRGVLVGSPAGDSFTAYTAGTVCTGSLQPSQPTAAGQGSWNIHCQDSDEPWPLASSPPDEILKAFYNDERNFFSGAVTPSQGVDLVPFYDVALLPRPGSSRPALLIGAIDGRVLMAESGVLKTVGGTRDWGSDFAILHSTCADGTQVVASSSGEAQNDSLRVYSVRGQEAIAASAPLDMGGAVMALWATPANANGAEVMLAVVRKMDHSYEVDRVTTLCQ